MASTTKEIEIKKGDTLSQIARMYNTSVSELANLNKIENVDYIRAGDTLKIPQSFQRKQSKEETPEETPALSPPIEEIISELERDETLAARLNIPINVRQFFRPEQNRTERDLSDEQLEALRTVVSRSQSPERIQEKLSEGLDPRLIEYKDYETGTEYGDVGGSGMGIGALARKIDDPFYQLKTFLGQATVDTTDEGKPVIIDTFDFSPKTTSTGLGRVRDYLASIQEQGLSPYGQLRNFMGYFGPQEGSGAGGRSRIAISSGGRTRQQFNNGGQMNLQQQANNVAAQGRYGDSMLMHVNPAEVRGLSQVMPLTVNPQTGQPEAFLPFLAPVLGSMVGSSLLGGTLGTLGASALGSGLAQWAATGDLKKGLLAGITGYGIGSALQGAGAANAATAGTENVIGSAAQQDLLSGDITNILTQNPELIESAANPALNTMGQMNLDSIMAGNPVQANIAAQGARASADYLAQDPTLFQSAKDAFSAGPTQGFQNLAAGATDPLALTTMAGGMAPTAIMESEEEFARQMAQRQAEEEERKRQNFLMNPEPILYSAQGGTTNFEDGGSTSTKDLFKMLSPAYSLATTGDYLNMLSGDVSKMGLFNTLYDNFNQKEEEIDKSLEMDSNLLSQQMMANGGRIGFNGKDGSDTNMFSGDQQRFTPARQAYDINPAFMAGFQPETMYFNPATINQPATATTTRAMPPVIDTYAGSKGGYNRMRVT